MRRETSWELRLLLAASVAEGDVQTDLAGGNVEADTILSLHTTEVSVGAGTTGVDGGALVVTADLHAQDVHAFSGGNEARSVGARPVIVDGTLEVELEPGIGELAPVGESNLADTARAAALSVVVSGKVLLLASTNVKLESLLSVEEAVDFIVAWANLVEAGTLHALASFVGEGGDVLVVLGNILVDNHHVAAVVVIGSDVALGENVGDGGALLVIVDLGVALAAAERLGLAAALAGAGLGLLLAGLLGLGRLLGLLRLLRLLRLLLLLGLGCGSSLGGGRGSSGLGDDRRSHGLHVHDEVAASLDGAVRVAVSVAAGASGRANGGAQESGGSGELHVDGGFVMLLLSGRLKTCFAQVVLTRILLQLCFLIGTDRG